MEEIKKEEVLEEVGGGFQGHKKNPIKSTLLEEDTTLWPFNATAEPETTGMVKRRR